jgi:hypothetical protein
MTTYHFPGLDPIFVFAGGAMRLPIAKQRATSAFALGLIRPRVGRLADIEKMHPAEKGAAVQELTDLEAAVVAGRIDSAIMLAWNLGMRVASGEAIRAYDGGTERGENIANGTRRAKVRAYNVRTHGDKGQRAEIHFAEMIKAGLDRRKAAKVVCEEMGLSRAALRARLKRQRDKASKA